MKNALHLTLLSLIAVAMMASQSVVAQQSGGPEIIITEIMYNPPESGADSLEFLELYNATNGSIDLEGFYFSDGIEYVFPAGVSIDASGFVLLAKDSVAFETVFGMEAQEWTSMSLLNNGEALTLRNSFGVVMDTVEYDDILPWPAAANGQGASLVLCDPFSDNNDVTNWGTSTNNTGIVINGITIIADPGALSTCTVGLDEVAAAKGFSVYPNPSNGQLSIDLNGVPLDASSALTVYNTMGQVVSSRSLNSLTENTLRLDLAGHAGAFSVVVTTADARYVERVLLVD